MRIRVQKQVLKSTVIIFVTVLLLAIVMTGISRWEEKEFAVSSEETSSERILVSDYFNESDKEDLVYYDDAWYSYRSDLTTVLFIGLDKFEDDQKLNQYSNSQQSDFLLLLILDADQKTCTPIQINRDTIAEFPVLDIEGNRIGSTTEQIALAHTYGSGKEDSCQNTVEAVSNLLYGIRIDHYVSVTMDAVQYVNDLIGGVTVTVLDDFSRIDSDLAQGQTITLYGEQALTYVRTRQGLEDSSNLHRMERQQQYMTAFRDQFQKSISDNPELLLTALTEISPYLVSDCTVNQLLDLNDKTNVYVTADILTLEGQSIKEEKYMAFYPDEDLLRSLIVRLFYEPKES